MGLHTSSTSSFEITRVQQGVWFEVILQGSVRLLLHALFSLAWSRAMLCCCPFVFHFLGAL